MIQKTFIRFFVVAVLVGIILPCLVHAKKKEIQLTGPLQRAKEKNIPVLIKNWDESLKAGESKRYYPETSSPEISEGTVYVGTQGKRFYAVDAAKGRVLWTYQGDEPISSKAQVAYGKVYFTDLGGHMICLNQADGRLIWKQAMDREMLGQPVVLGDRLYILKGEQTVVALSASTGNILWEKFIRTYLREITMRGHATLVGDGSLLYVGLGDGHLYALSANSGEIIWDKNLSLPLRTFKDIDGSVVIVGDALYVGGYFGAVYKLNKRSGGVLWMTETATGVPLSVVEDVVIVANTSGALEGLDIQDGMRLWVNDLNGSVLSAPVSFGDKVFVSTFDGDAYLVLAQNGQQIQRLSLGGSITQPVVDGDRIYLLTNSATLLALRAK